MRADISTKQRKTLGVLRAPMGALGLEDVIEKIIFKVDGMRGDHEAKGPDDVHRMKIDV